MYQYLYTSRAVAPFADADLLGLLEWSRTFNPANGITGLLLYYPDDALNNGVFMQYLEGAEGDVRSLMRRIEHDPRHTAIETYLDEPREGRLFSRWAMAHASPASVPLPNAFLRVETLELPLAERREAALWFLSTFRETALEMGTPGRRE